MKERVVSTGRNTTDFSPKKIGDRIRDLRRSAHLSQAELAQHLGIQQGPISNLENGKHMPSARVLIALATFFEVSIDALLGIDSPRSIIYEKTSELKIAYEWSSPNSRAVWIASLISIYAIAIFSFSSPAI